jgi:large subunit ribosomal protein L9
MALPATPANQKVLAENMKQKAHKEAKIKSTAEDLSESLRNLVVRIGAKAAESGKIFGSVNAIQVAQALKEQFDFDIDRKKIHVDHEHIKELGTYHARVLLHKDVQVEITLEVFAE